MLLLDLFGVLGSHEQEVFSIDGLGVVPDTQVEARSSLSCEGASPLTDFPGGEVDIVEVVVLGEVELLAQVFQPLLELVVVLELHVVDFGGPGLPGGT